MPLDARAHRLAREPLGVARAARQLDLDRTERRAHAAPRASGQRRPVAPLRLRGFTITRVRCATARRTVPRRSRAAARRRPPSVFSLIPGPRTVDSSRVPPSTGSPPVYALLLELTALLTFWLCLGAWQEEGAASGRRAFVGLALAVFAWSVGVLARVEGLVTVDQVHRIAMVGAIAVPALWLGLGAARRGPPADAPPAAGCRFAIVAPQLTLYATLVRRHRAAGLLPLRGRRPHRARHRRLGQRGLLLDARRLGLAGSSWSARAGCARSACRACWCALASTAPVLASIADPRVRPRRPRPDADPARCRAAAAALRALQRRLAPRARGARARRS